MTFDFSNAKKYQLTGNNLTIEQIYEMANAKCGEIFVELTDKSVQSILKSRAYVDQIVNEGKAVYGINT